MDLEKAGVALHTIADFYSHSNYVELYQKLTDGKVDIKDIPTFSEAMKNPELVKYLQDNGLTTGTYDTKDKKGLIPGSHGEINKDTNTSGRGKDPFNDKNTMHDAARSLAEREFEELAKKWNRN